MISAKSALAAINKELDHESDFFKMWQINKMIKAAAKLGQDKIILSYMTNDMMDILYDKGYRIYKTYGTIRDTVRNEPGVEHVERIPMYVVQWKHAKDAEV